MAKLPNMRKIRALRPEQREAELRKYREELMHLKSMLSAGGSIDNPGRVSELRKTIARLETVKNEL